MRFLKRLDKKLYFLISNAIVFFFSQYSQMTIFINVTSRHLK